MGCCRRLLLWPCNCLRSALSLDHKSERILQDGVFFTECKYSNVLLARYFELASCPFHFCFRLASFYYFRNRACTFVVFDGCDHAP